MGRDSKMDDVLVATSANAAMFAFGFFMKKLHYFEQEDGVRGLGLIVKCLLPFALVTNIPKSDMKLAWFIVPCTCLLYNLVTISASRILFKYFFNGLSRHDRGQMTMCCTGSAVGLVGIPIVQGYYGTEGLARTVLYDLPNCFVAYGMTYIIATLYQDTEEVTHEVLLHRSATAVNLAGGHDNHSTHHEALIALRRGGIMIKRLSGMLHIPHGSKKKRSSTMSSESSADEAIKDKCDKLATSMESSDPNDSEDAIPLERNKRDKIPKRIGNDASADDGDIGNSSENNKVSALYDNGTDGPSVSVSRRTLEEGVHLLVGFKKTKLVVVSANILKQPVFVAFFVGLIMLYTGTTVEQLPYFISGTVPRISMSCGYMTFVVLGIFFSPELFLQWKYMNRVMACVLVKYVTAVLFCVGLQLLNPADKLLANVAGMCTLMPVPPIVIAFSGAFHYDTKFAAMIVNASIVVAFVFGSVFAMIVS